MVPPLPVLIFAAILDVRPSSILLRLASTAAVIVVVVFAIVANTMAAICSGVAKARSKCVSWRVFDRAPPPCKMGIAIFFLEPKVLDQKSCTRQSENNKECAEDRCALQDRDNKQENYRPYWMETHSRNDDVFIDVELDNSVHFEKCLDVVVLCAEEGVSRCFRPQPLNAEPCSHYKRHRWGARAFPSSSTWSGYQGDYCLCCRRFRDSQFSLRTL